MKIGLFAMGTGKMAGGALLKTVAADAERAGVAGERLGLAITVAGPRSDAAPDDPLLTFCRRRVVSTTAACTEQRANHREHDSGPDEHVVAC